MSGDDESDARVETSASADDIFFVFLLFFLVLKNKSSSVVLRWFKSKRRALLRLTCPSVSLACNFLCRALFAETNELLRDALLYRFPSTILCKDARSNISSVAQYSCTKQSMQKTMLLMAIVMVSKIL